MPYSILKAPSHKFKIQFRSRHIQGSINRTLPTKAEAINLRKELDESLEKLIHDEKAIPAYPPQTLIDCVHPLLASHILHRPYFSDLGIDSKGNQLTLSHLIDNYLLWHNSQPDKTDYGVAPRLRWWGENYGHIAIESFTAIDVSEGIEKIISGKGVSDKKPRTPQTSNRYKANLSSVFTYAIKPKRVHVKGSHTPKARLIANPCRLVQGEPEGTPRRRSLTLNEQERLIEASKQSEWKHIYALVLMALTCGARKGELMGLRWKDIDWSNNTFFVLRTKNGDSKEMSIIPKLKDYLFKLWDSVKLSTNDINVKDHLIFRGTVSPFRSFTMHKQWIKTLERAEIEPLDDKYGL
jgi:integrase